MTRERLRALALAFLGLAGCYASHEPPAVCATDDACPSGEYCELRFLCLDGSLDCDPFRSGSGCAWFADDESPFGGYIDCEGELSTGLGLCAPPELRELWR